MTDPEEDLRDMLAWREPDWDALPHAAWTHEVHRAAQLAGAAIAALREGYRQRPSARAPVVVSVEDRCRADMGEIELARGGPWDCGRDRIRGAGPDDVDGLLREFDALLGP